MDVESFLLAEWFLWLRGVLLAVVGFLLGRRRSYGAIALALLSAYWAYNSISFMVEFRADVLEQIGLGYMLRAYAALLMPFGIMALGLVLKGKPGAKPDDGPEGVPSASGDDLGTEHGPVSVSPSHAQADRRGDF
jgi:hypothetical protein